MVQSIHLHECIRQNRRHARAAETPREIIPPPGEEAHHATPLRPRRHGRPVVHARGGGHGAGQFGDARGNGPVEDGDDDELVQHAWGTAVEDGYEDGAADGGPDGADDEADAG
ncbi:hypothetical protein HG530_013186 [Fusarium avenaceum]|nr:hypothetical protein HG530_013186 [Fusarium avenaceum]